MQERFGWREGIDEVASATRSVFSLLPRCGITDGVGPGAAGKFERIGEITADSFDARQLVFASSGEFGRHIHCANDADEVAHRRSRKWLFTPGDHLNECTVFALNGEHQKNEPLF